jgi:hypothetical protein
VFVFGAVYVEATPQSYSNSRLKVNFGLKPTFRIVQKIVYREARAEEPVYAVAEKQLYASHYFQTAVALTVCFKDAQRPGFYVVTVKGRNRPELPD